MFTGTVDDHFAKALGDTWHKLQAQNGRQDNQSPSATVAAVVSPVQT